MFWNDAWDEAFDEVVYDHEIEEEEDDERYFDVPIQYRPISLLTKRKTMSKEDTALTFVDESRRLCKKLMETPHYRKMGEDGIFAIIQKAKSIGVDPLDALNGGMFFVQGKVEMTAGMMNDLIRRKGHSITKDKTSNDKICILHGKRKDNNDTWSESFSIEDAEKAGILKGSWLKYPKDMLFARALSRLARQLFPDVIKGCYVESEISQVSVQEREEIEVKAQIPDISIEEMNEVLVANLMIDEPQHLIEYLTMVKSKIDKPLRELLTTWLENPDKFLAHYAKWAEKKNLESKNTIEYSEDNQGAFLSHG